MKKIAIIILNWNGKQDTLECLHSIKKSAYTNYEIIVADNGSHDGSKEAIACAFTDVLILDNQSNLGFAEGNNRALQIALAKEIDYIFLLNNDATIEPSTLNAFLDFSEKYPNAIIGGKPILASKKTHLDHLGGFWNPKKGEFDLVGYRDLINHWSSPLFLDYITGCSMFIPKKVLLDIGLFDARFFLYWEESDLCFRAKKLGYQVLYCPDAVVFHKVSASFIGGKPHTSYYFWRNRYLWIEKNLTLKEKIKIFPTLYLKTLKVIRHYFIRSIEIKLLSFVKQPDQKKLEKVAILKASFFGIRDYFLRRFYAGPSWLFKSSSRLNIDQKN